MYNDVDFEKIMLESRQTLEELKSKKSKTTSLIKENHNNTVRFTRGSYLYEEYDALQFEGKIKIDLLYYEQFLQKLDESATGQVEKLLISTYSTIREIYEFININPEIYGKGINASILDSSIETTKRKLSSVVYEFLNHNFYNLTPEQRKTRYFEAHKEFAKKLISEGAEPSEAIEFSVKSVVIENLLRNIAFPFAIWSRINTLCEDEDYGKIFDKDALIELVNTFQSKIKNVSRIVSTCV